MESSEDTRRTGSRGLSTESSSVSISWSKADLGRPTGGAGAQPRTTGCSASDSLFRAVENRGHVAIHPRSICCGNKRDGPHDTRPSRVPRERTATVAARVQGGTQTVSIRTWSPWGARSGICREKSQVTRRVDVGARVRVPLGAVYTNFTNPNDSRAIPWAAAKNSIRVVLRYRYSIFLRFSVMTTLCSEAFRNSTKRTSG